MDVHWEHVSNGFNSTLYLLKTLRQLGFNQRVLVSVYKSLISSQIVANATTLCSVSENAKNEMIAIQKRALKIMDVKESDMPTLKIKGIDELIEERCTQQINKILADDEHPITLGLQKRSTDASRNKFPFAIPRCNTARHQNSFVPKYTRRVEATKPKPSKQTATTYAAFSPTKTACPTCGKLFIRLKTHQQRAHKGVNCQTTEMHLNELPDFNNNYEFVTVRRNKQHK